jgi:hypothetical protein
MEKPQELVQNTKKKRSQVDKIGRLKYKPATSQTDFS